MASNYQLIPINPREVDFNESNPRGEGVDEILKDPEFELLKDSVYQYGVLVPVVVHTQQKKDKPYKLVDGERRLRAALLTNTPTIPAHVAHPPPKIDDIVAAFHIHMLRKQWRPVAQARALKRIVKELESSGEIADEEKLLQELKEKTACSDTRLKALRRAIRFPDSVLDAAASGKIQWSHLVQIEESVLEHLDDYPEVGQQISKSQARRALIEKVRRGIVGGTRDLMDNIAPVFARAKTPKEKGTASKLIVGFLKNPDATAQSVRAGFEKAFPMSGTEIIQRGRDILETADHLAADLNAIGGDFADSYPDLARKLRKSLMQLKKSATNALRRISNS
jgi:ParB/RepB/Spo0J family partition protein